MSGSNTIPIDPVRVALVGAGEFGATFLAQARRIREIDVRVVCDLDIARARAAGQAAGFEPGDLAPCDSRAAVLGAIGRGAVALIADPALLSDLPLGFVVEATGDPEAAGVVAERALAGGYNLALVTKEAEVVVGPVLAAKAKAAGLVHTPVDGDQPSLLVGLVERARLLGLPVVAAGKSTESDYVFDPERETVSAWGRSESRPGYGRAFSDAWDSPEALAARLVAGLDTATVPDLCEMTIVANHCGLAPDRPELHAPVARTTELARIFAPAEHGGILRSRGVVDVFTCLRRPDELSFAGGVFVVVETPDPATGRLLAGKGIPGSPDGRYLMLHNPVHLLGAEAPASLLFAARHGRGTGGADVRPLHDLVARAARDFAPGETLALGARHTLAGLDPLILPASALSEASPIPYYLAAGSRIARAVRAGALLTLADVVLDETRALVRLRREQDRHFDLA